MLNYYKILYFIVLPSSGTRVFQVHGVLCILVGR